MIDILYLTWNRLEFTRLTWTALCANTDWSYVNHVYVYDDGSRDGTREYMDEHLADAGAPASLSFLGFGSPVRAMMHYLAGDEPAPIFAKVDNDIAMPPGWLPAMADVMNSSPDLELLGVQYGFGDDPPDEPVRRTYFPCGHIGGVGLMRTSAFGKRRSQMNPAGRFGFTQWQYQMDPVRGWLSPSLLAPQLDLIPDMPYAGWSQHYLNEGWQRKWPPYRPESHRLWDWLKEVRW